LEIRAVTDAERSHTRTEFIGICKKNIRGRNMDRMRAIIHHPNREEHCTW
jgi:hypothetical protein